RSGHWKLGPQLTIPDGTQAIGETSRSLKTTSIIAPVNVHVHLRKCFCLIENVDNSFRTKTTAWLAFQLILS
ncbi:hypothetical protein TNIN_96331, partial [Trichonephila inaurata madagascariensis]